MTEVYDWANNIEKEELKQIHDNTLLIQGYEKAFIVNSEPEKNKIIIYVSYKSVKKKFGVVKLENSDYLATKKGYYLYSGANFSDSSFNFTNDEFPEISFEFSLGTQEIIKSKKQIKDFLVSSDNFVLLGRKILLKILEKFKAYEEKYNQINKDWHK